MMQKSVTIGKAKNGFVVSHYNETTGNREMTVHANMDDATKMVKKMMMKGHGVGGKMGGGMTVTADQKKKVSKAIKGR